MCGVRPRIDLEAKHERSKALSCVPKQLRGCAHGRKVLNQRTRALLPVSAFATKQRPPRELQATLTVLTLAPSLKVLPRAMLQFRPSLAWRPAAPRPRPISRDALP